MLLSSDNVDVSIANIDQVIEINRTDFVALIDRAIIYPQSKSIEMVQLVIDYHCEDDKCSYESVLKEIIHGSKAVELKALGVKELTTEIVTAIDRSPEIFIPSSLNGYLFQKLGKPYLFLRNNSDDGSSMKQRYGLLEQH